MNIKTKTIRRLAMIGGRELKMYSHRPLFLFCMIIAPLFCLIYLTSLMSEGLPTKLPAAMVDEDNTHITHTITRILGSMEEVKLVRHYSTFGEARKAMQRGEIYGFFYLPKKTTEKALASRQPRISFYTNECYYVPGNLLMRDMRYASELTGLALTREKLYAHGLTERQAMGVIQPIKVETHPLNNPYLDYSVYLNNMLIPGIFILLVMLSAAYTIGIEWKRNTQLVLYRMSGKSPLTAICRQAAAADACVLAYSHTLCRLLLPLPAVPLQQWVAADDTHRYAYGVGRTGSCRLLFRRMRTDASVDVSLLALGHIVVLARRLHVPRDGDGRHTAEAVCFVPAAPLLSAICQSGSKRIQHRVRLAQLARNGDIRIVAAAHAAPLSQSVPEP